MPTHGAAPRLAVVVAAAAARPTAAPVRGAAAHDHGWRRQWKDHAAGTGDGGRERSHRRVVSVRDVGSLGRTTDRRPTDSLRCRARRASAGPDDVDPLDRLNELVLGASPRQVCLVVDDVHVLGRSEALERLIDSLPANGHVLASGRATPAFSTARLDAAGQLEEIHQDELLLTDDELIQFANLRGVDVTSLSGAEGWPAFVELATAGTEARVAPLPRRGIIDRPVTGATARPCRVLVRRRWRRRDLPCGQWPLSSSRS